MYENLTNGRWLYISSETEHDNVKSYGSINDYDLDYAEEQYGSYSGPNWYYVLTDEEPCSKGFVREVISPLELVQFCKETMIELASLLRDARKRSSIV